MAEQICPTLQAFHGIYLEEGSTQRHRRLQVGYAHKGTELFATPL